jgi:hypothetical protein
MAFGVSTLAILTALRVAGGSGRLVSIDPHQSTQWRGCGRAAVDRAGLRPLHELIEEFSHLALPRMLGSGLRVDFAYIDGWHTFDAALIDSWYLDKMLEVGGVLGFNDCDFPSVAKAIGFLLSHRRYREDGPGPPPGLAYAAGMTPDRYFRKAEGFEPNWDFFMNF